ncbi:MAG: TIGR04372 family glycosyltransferase [Verrucomicrobia bacterium]|nr:TIGR04372 family glycosyltransferase [Verrucomicrobiota bacterium]
MLRVNQQSFLQRQIDQLKAGGWPVFARKVQLFSQLLPRRLLSLIGIIGAAPLVLFIVAIRPFVRLRFGTIVSQRIGHFAADTEAYLCAHDHENPRRRTIDVIGCPEPACNRQLQMMWARTLCLTPRAWLWNILDRACRFWTRGEVHHVKLYDRGSDYRLFLATKSHLGFTAEEHCRGQALLRKLGIPSGASWVCIHNRDGAYLDKALGGRWAYHDYRDFSVQTMVSAAEELSKRGYYVVRVGSIVEEALTSPDPKIIDYANSPLRSEFMDIYLLAHGAFFLGNDSGIWCIPLIFRKPLLMVNFTLLSNFFEKDYEPWFIILKRSWHREKQRFLSLRELFETGLACACTSQEYEAAGVELICNTPEEICDLAIEVDERLKGQWQSQPGDEDLQQRFWATFRQYIPSDRNCDIHARIGTVFLRQHRDWLE